MFITYMSGIYVIMPCLFFLLFFWNELVMYEWIKDVNIRKYIWKKKNYTHRQFNFKTTTNYKLLEWIFRYRKMFYFFFFSLRENGSTASHKSKPYQVYYGKNIWV